MARKKIDEIGLNEQKCPICGKIFFPTPLHVYKRQHGSNKNSFKWLCSYSCLFKYDREHPAKRHYRTMK